MQSPRPPMSLWPISRRLRASGSPFAFSAAPAALAETLLIAALLAPPRRMLPRCRRIARSVLRGRRFGKSVRTGGAIDRVTLSSWVVLFQLGMLRGEPDCGCRCLADLFGLRL